MMAEPKPNTDPISKALNISPMESEKIEIVGYTEANTLAEFIKADYDLTRINIQNILVKGENSLDKLIQLAQSSGHPRAFEVLAGFIKTLVESNKDLLEIDKKYKDLTGENAPTTVNNTLYVGTPAELLKMIKNAKNEEES